MSRDFTTKPRPDQPGRCPSIDPHDTLQCTRAIHDDDQCQAGGIAWRKGSPRIEWDRERADRLQEEIEEYDAILTRQSDLLTRTVNALRGNPPPLTSWSHHDIPELAAEKVAEVARLTAERDALAAQVARAESLAEDPRYKGQFGWGPWQLGEGPDPEGYVMDHCASALRDALAGPEADTSDTQSTDSEAYPADHGWTPSNKFSPGHCRVMLARYPCSWAESDHDPTLPREDVDAFGYRRTRRDTQPTDSEAE